MARWRRPGADEILLAFLLLAVIGYISSWLSHDVSPRELPSSVLTMAFLVWRVSRGGRIARMILIISCAASCALGTLALARLWDVAVMAMVITCAAMTALLVSVPVYARTRPTPIQVRAAGWAQLVRRPPAWLLSWALLAGVLLTLACLASVDFTPISGCRPAASSGCAALVRGYPLRWLTAYQNEPVISAGALLKDCAQWALTSMSVLYLAWLWLTPLDRPVRLAGSRAAQP